jgi:hypothetical protein
VVTLNDTDRKVVAHEIEVTGKRYVSYPWLVGFLFTFSLAIVGIVYSAKMEMKADLQRQLNGKVDKGQYCADVEGLKALIHTEFLAVKMRMEDLERLHPRGQKEAQK